MNEKQKSKITKLQHSIDESSGVVSVELQVSPKYGREPTLKITPEDVRSWLRDTHSVEVGSLISGVAIHNSLDRRLGNRTEADLMQTYRFALPQTAEVKVKPEPAAKPEAKPAPKPKTKVAKVEEVSTKPTPRRKATTTTAAKTTKAKTTTRSRRNNSTKKLTKDSE
mgnify:CR=1 FL=1